MPILNDYEIAGFLLLLFASFFIFVVPQMELRRKRRESRYRNQARPWHVPREK